MNVCLYIANTIITWHVCIVSLYKTFISVIIIITIQNKLISHRAG